MSTIQPFIIYLLMFLFVIVAPDTGT